MDFEDNKKPRPMIGVLSQLSEKQKEIAFSYDGPECHGNSFFKIKGIENDTFNN